MRWKEWGFESAGLSWVWEVWGQGGGVVVQHFGLAVKSERGQ